MADTKTRSRPVSRGGVMLADGSFFEGVGFGAAGAAVGEVCFNTAMTGYQEILSDPSYAGQIVAFTFPHIGIVGTNSEDIETITPAVRGLIVRADAESPSNYRSLAALDRWLKTHNIPAVAGIDTRALTSLIREKGMPHGVIANAGSGSLDKDALLKQAKEFPGLVGLDLAKDVTARQMYKWSETPWAWDEGYGDEAATPSFSALTVMDYGVKRNILRLLAGLGADITVVPASATLDEVMASRDPAWRAAVQRPGRDPAATGTYEPFPPSKLRGRQADCRCSASAWVIRCRRLALGAKTKKRRTGLSSYGANHPGQGILTTGKVEIVSMRSMALYGGPRNIAPGGVSETQCLAVRRHQFAASRVDGKRSVQCAVPTPEASPGPMGSALSRCQPLRECSTRGT